MGAKRDEKVSVEHAEFEIIRPAEVGAERAGISRSVPGRPPSELDVQRSHRPTGQGPAGPGWPGQACRMPCGSGSYGHKPWCCGSGGKGGREGSQMWVVDTSSQKLPCRGVQGKQ